MFEAPWWDGSGAGTASCCHICRKMTSVCKAWHKKYMKQHKTSLNHTESSPKASLCPIVSFLPPLEGTLPLDSLYTFFFHRFLCLLTTHRHCWSLQKELNILRLYYSRKHSKSATYKAVYKMLAAVSSTINITINILQFFALRHINSVSWSGFWFK